MRRARERRAGYTLLELLLVAVVLSIVLGSLALFGRQSTVALRTNTAQSDLESRLQNTLVRITRELLPSGFAVIAPAAAQGVPQLDYRKSDGVVNGTLVWGEPHRIGFEHEAGEPDDGLDNDGDGFVDEGVVVWTIDPGQPGEIRAILCHGVRELASGETANGQDDNGNGLVDEPGLSFEQQGERMIVRLALEGRDPEGRTLVHALEAEVQPRN